MQRRIRSLIRSADPAVGLSGGDWLDGFHDGKRTGIAGWAALWNGWTQLQDQLLGYLAARDGCRTTST
jgi:hypothetical protein